MKKIDANFFQRNTLTVCENLIGGIISHKSNDGEIVAVITEIEGYLGVEDRGSHSFGGKKTKRLEAMYMSGGHLYVYFVYGMHFQLNFVTDKQVTPAGILLRGVSIISGENIAAQRRYGKNYDSLTSYQKKHLANGPGKVAQVFNIDTSCNKKIFDEVFEVQVQKSPCKYETHKRIGIDYAGVDKDKPYRYVLIGQNCE